VNATGGGTVYAENAKADIERAYARAIGDARNQYTLAYSAKPGGAGGYRQIIVNVRRPGLKVYAKDGYYPCRHQIEQVSNSGLRSQESAKTCRGW